MEYSVRRLDDDNYIATFSEVEWKKGEMDEFKSKYDINKITHVIIKNVDTVHTLFFNNFPNLQEITFANNINYIDRFAVNNCQKLKSIIVSQECSICDSAFFNCPELEKVFLPGTINSLNEYFIACCDKLNALYFRGENIIKHYPDCNFSEKELELIYGAILSKILSPKEKDYILSGKHKFKDCFSYCLMNNIDFLNSVYEKSIDIDSLACLDKEILNSDELCYFLKDKEVIHTSYMGDGFYSRFTNPQAVLSIFPSEIILIHLNVFPDSIRFNKDFLNKVFQNKKPDDKICFLSSFRETLLYFKDDEDLVGKFANMFGEQMLEPYCEFVRLIGWEKDDFNKMGWLISNNIAFLETLPPDKMNEYLLYLCSSFDFIEHKKQGNFTRIVLTSAYNSINISIKDDIMKISIKDQYDHCLVNYLTIDKDQEIYEDILSTIKNTLNEINKEEERENK